MVGLFFVASIGDADAQRKKKAKDPTYKPFIHAFNSSSDLSSVVVEVKEKLSAGGFEVLGEFSAYDNSVVLGVTNDALKSVAAETKYGGYGAAQRVSIVSMDGQTQVAFTNPTYMSYAYHMKTDLADVTAALKAALGEEGGEYGLKKAKTKKKLNKYHYMISMPYFDDEWKLAEHDSYDAAIAKVEEGFASAKGGVSKVYRLDIPGKDQTVYAVGMTEKCANDQFVMDEIDFKEVRSAAHLPYELLVDGGTVYALHAKFRIAINFPDLSMMGKNSFLGIMCSPDDIRDSLRAVSGYEKKKRKRRR
jgi:hypothetical protein